MPMKCAPVTINAIKKQSLLPARKILIVTLEPVAEKMAGPAIRSLEIGRQLASDFAVTLYTPAQQSGKDATAASGGKSSVNIVGGAGRNQLYALAEEHDVVRLIIIQ